MAGEEAAAALFLALAVGGGAIAASHVVQEGQIKKAMNHTHSNAALKSHNHAGRYAPETGFRKLENKVKSINETVNNHTGSRVRPTPNDHHVNLLRFSEAGELYAGKKMEENVTELANALAALNQKVSEVSSQVPSQVPDEMDRVVLTFDMSGFRQQDLFEDVIEKIQDNVSRNSFVKWNTRGWSGGLYGRMSELGVDWSLDPLGEGGQIRFWNKMPLPASPLSESEKELIIEGGRMPGDSVNTNSGLYIGLGTENYLFFDLHHNTYNPNHRRPPQTIVTTDKFGWITVEHNYFVSAVYFGGVRYNVGTGSF